MRISALILVLLCGCLPPIGGNSDKHETTPDTSSITTAAESALREKARLMAAIARQAAAKRRSGEFKEYADLQVWESTQNEATKAAYKELLAAQESRLKRDADGNLAFSDDAEADARVWDETADGFERVANGLGR